MSLLEHVRADVETLIAATGYDLTTADEALLTVCAANAEWLIRNECYVDAVPEGLYSCAARMIAADVLAALRSGGILEDDALTFEPALKQLQEGDTNVVFDASGTLSPDQRFEAYLAALRSCRGQLVTYRRLAW